MMDTQNRGQLQILAWEGGERRGMTLWSLDLASTRLQQARFAADKPKWTNFGQPWTMRRG
jgi:hypothetical protein